MIGEILGSVLGMVAGFVRPALPFVGGFFVVAIVAVCIATLIWVRPLNEPDPLPAIDPRASDRLGEP